MESVKTGEFLSVTYGDGSGYGDGYGYGDGNGYGYGSGYGSGDGYGYGYGNGYGYGYGDGNGYGYGSGNGYGSGYGDGNGYGYGSGDGIKGFCGHTVHNIDGVQTIINRVHRGAAKGNILQADLSLTPCFVVKHENIFAHGKTLKEAQEALEEKIFNNIDVEEKISMFLAKFKPKKKYSASAFYEWHNKLTGSCKAGRDAFVKDLGIDINTAKYTVGEFITITENAYGGEVIRQLKERMEGKGQV